MTSLVLEKWQRVCLFLSGFQVATVMRSEKFKRLAIYPLALLMFLGAGGLQAAFCFNSTVATREGVTFAVDPDPAVAADACFVAANPNRSESGMLALVADRLGQESNPWIFLLKSEDGAASGSVAGLNFSLTSDSGSNGGWVLSWEDPSHNLPVSLDFAVLISAGRSKKSTLYGGTAGYLFDNEFLHLGSDSGSGSFKVVFANKSGQLKHIDHLTIAARVNDAVFSPSRGSKSGVVDAPEPHILWLMLMGGIGLAVGKKAGWT